MRWELLRDESLIKWLNKINSGAVKPGRAKPRAADALPNLEAAHLIEDGLPLPRLCLYYDGEYQMEGVFQPLFHELSALWRALEGGDVPWIDRSRVKPLHQAIERASVDVLIVIDLGATLDRVEVRARYRRYVE